jgi:hypothetical protein
MRAATAYRYLGSQGVCYTADGSFDLEQPGHGFDLIEECEPDSLAELTGRQKELDAYFCGSEHSPKLSLCETLVKAARGMRMEPSETSTRADIAYLDGHNAALAEMEAEIVKRFAALSVEKIWDVIDEGLRAENVHGSMTQSVAQAVMKLLRKE